MCRPVGNAIRSGGALKEPVEPVIGFQSPPTDTCHPSPSRPRHSTSVLPRRSSVFSRVFPPSACGGCSLAPPPPPGGRQHPPSLSLSALPHPHNPHPQPRRARSRRISHSPGVKQPSRLTQPLRGSLRLHRRQGRPIELAELLPLGEQQHRIRTVRGCQGIRSWLPRAIALHHLALCVRRRR